jgi:hypothetical protein
VGYFWMEINIKRPEPDAGSQSDADYWHLVGFAGWIQPVVATH